MRTFKGNGYSGFLDLGKVLKGKEAAGKQGVEMAAAFLVGGYKEDLSVPGPTPDAPTVRPSKPGEPPRRREGQLRDHVFYEMDGTTARVGTSLKKGYWLEWGTVEMAARPWLRPGLARRAKQIKDIVVAYLRKG